MIVGSGNEPNGVFFLLNVLLVGTVPYVIARALWRRGTIDVHTVMGAVCIYVLLGMMFAFVYAAIDAMSSGPFFVQTAHATAPDFLYFSFITQTTVGYGDFTAKGDLGRATGGARGAGRAALPGDGDRGPREPPEWSRPTGSRGHRGATGRGRRRRRPTPRVPSAIRRPDRQL